MFASILSHINIILEQHVSNPKILKNIPHFNIYNKPENPFQTMTSQNNWLISSKLKSIYGNYIDSFGSNFFQIDSSWFNKVNHNQFCGLKYFYFVHYGSCTVVTCQRMTVLVEPLSFFLASFTTSNHV